MDLAKLYTDYIEMVLLFGFFAIMLNGFAISKNYYTFHARPSRARGTLAFRQVIAFFGIYLTMSIAVSSLIARMVRSVYSFEGKQLSLPGIGLIQLSAILLTLFFFYLYAKTLDKPLIKRIFKDRSASNSKPLYWDIVMGILTWTISFPLVIAVGQLIDMLLYLSAGLENYEQVAVRYLKLALSSPSMLMIALFMILFAAPAIEEFLFRGLLQTYLKRFMPIKWAIALSSLCFAFFHFSPSQGIGNISLIASLFTFALYLGFIYERQASLIASFTLHMTFNTVSTLRILFFSDS